MPFPKLRSHGGGIWTVPRLRALEVPSCAFPIEFRLSRSSLAADFEETSLFRGGFLF